MTPARSASPDLPVPPIDDERSDAAALYPTLRAPMLRLAPLGRFVIGGIDRLVRWISGVREFSDEPECLLRIARVRAPATVRLAEGIYVLRGSEILDLHLWNERLPDLPSPNRGFSRANAWRRRLTISLAKLADHIDREPSMREVVAIRGHTTFVSTDRLAKLLRTAGAFGLSPAVVVGREPRRGRFYPILEALFRRALAQAFNPAAARKSRSPRQPCDLWISRSRLTACYGRGHLTGPLQREAGDRARPVASCPANAAPSSQAGSAAGNAAERAKARMEGGNKCRSTG